MVVISQPYGLCCSHDWEYPVLTYTTLDGQVLDLSDLTDEERAHLERCRAAFGRDRTRLAWEDFNNRFLMGAENPLLRETGGWVTRAITRRPLYQAVHDLSDRLGIEQGDLEPEPGDDSERDPFADDWIPATEAATRAGVTLPGLHKAIRRGDVIARPNGAGGRLLVSANSLKRWTPNPVRQAARRKGLARARISILE
jgi:hypothetical protein